MSARGLPPDRRGAALVLALAVLVLLAGVQQLAVAVALAASRRAAVEEAKLQRQVSQHVWTERIERRLARGPADGVPGTWSAAVDTLVRQRRIDAHWAAFTVDLPDLPVRVIARRPPFPLPCATVVSRAPVAGTGVVRAPPQVPCTGWVAMSAGEPEALWRAVEAAVAESVIQDTMEVTANPLPRVIRARHVLRVADGAAVAGLLVAPFIDLGAGAQVTGTLVADSIRTGSGSRVLGDSALVAAAWQAAVRFLPLRTGRLLAFP